MRRKAGEALPASVVPCPSFEMSDRFRDWAVDRMRGEVGGLVGAAGLDRMAILKGSKADNVAGKEKQPE